MDTIRIIHNLPRSGGSIISKSISAQKDIILLSEIHPDGPKIIKKRGTEAKYADPLYQFQNWYKLSNTFLVVRTCFIYSKRPLVCSAFRFTLCAVQRLEPDCWQHHTIELLCYAYYLGSISSA